jgi:hypothetical protein
LHNQIRIASRLEESEGKYHATTICAWDLVEELSQNIAELDVTYKKCMERHYIRYEKFYRDDAMSEREYDV